jgi:hypothetical protein
MDLPVAGRVPFHISQRTSEASAGLDASKVRPRKIPG